MTSAQIEHVDVLIVGAGLAGVGAACHLRRECPDKTFAVLEARADLGGTWDLFRYPGIRSDSDMYTLGYEFKPWLGAKSITDGQSILDYIRETADEYDVTRHIRYQHRVVRAEWSSVTALWTVTAQRGTAGESVTFTCSFLSVCTGYYRYDRGHRPEFPGEENFTGTFVHPQLWPEDLDYTGRRVVVIGSGATAMTLVPSLAETAEHVTMLQRTPTYVASLPARDKIADVLRRRLPAHMAYLLVRIKNVLFQMVTYKFSRRYPQLVRRALLRGVKRHLPTGYDLKNFNPDYNPWDQRVCAVPDADLFRVIRERKADVLTDQITQFTADGIELASGKRLPADIVITATGLSVLMLGGMEIVVDGTDVSIADKLMYKGMMLSDVPNFALTIGYTNASWTLKADLVARYLCRVIHHMDEHGYDIVTPVAPSGSLDEATPLFDLKAGYVLRNLYKLPRQGAKMPWRLYQSYFRDLRLMRYGSLSDDVRFSRKAPAPPTSASTSRNADVLVT